MIKLLLVPPPEIVSTVDVVLVVDKWGQSKLIEPTGTSREKGKSEAVLLMETSAPLTTVEGVA
ncbi:MAG: hypothetical protein AB7V46_20875 [Thermomicrobiales bacterium]